MNDLENTKDSELSSESVAVRKGFVHTDAFVMLCLYIGTLIIHILMAQCATIFNLTPDEYSVAAVGAYVNGYDWSSTVSTGGYYGYLQGLFYAPVYLLTDDGFLQYKLMLVINGILMSFAPVIVYYLSRRAFDIKKGASILFSFICGLYPCYMLLTKFTWNETTCNILPWLFIFLMYKSLSCENTVKKQILSVLGGLTLVAGYATHGRMLALLGAGVVTVLVAFFLLKKRIFCFTGFFASLGAGVVLDYILKDHFQRVLWLSEALDKTPGNTLESTLGRVADAGAEFIGNFVKTTLGHLFYFISATWGFGAICIVIIIACAFMFFKRRIQNMSTNKARPVMEYLTDNDAILTVFAFFVMVAAFVISVVFKSTSSLIEERMDTMIYGRYTEVFYPVAIFTALVLIYRGKLSFIHTFASLCCASAICIMTKIFTVPTVLGGTRMVSGMILGIAPLRYGEGIKELPTEATFDKLITTVMAMLFVLLIIQLLRKKDKRIYQYFCFPLAGLLIYTNVYCYKNYNMTQSKNAVNGANYMIQALSMIEDSGMTVCCYDLTKERYVKAQFLYPDMELVIAKSMAALTELEERPDFIVSDKEDNLNLWFKDVYLVGSIGNTVHLYACNNEAYNYVKDKGLAVSENNIIHYDGAQILTTAEQLKTSGSAAVFEPRTAIYTNYTTLFKSGTYYITARGEGIDRDGVTITLKYNKGESPLNYKVVQKADGVLRIEVKADKKLPNVRFKLTNNTGEDIILDSISIEKGEKVTSYKLAKGVAYNTPV